MAQSYYQKEIYQLLVLILLMEVIMGIYLYVVQVVVVTQEGGHIYLSGNERAGADGGTLVLAAGNVSSGAVIRSNRC